MYKLFLLRAYPCRPSERNVKRLGLSDRVTLNDDQREAISFFLNQQASFLAFSGMSDVAKTIAECGRHSMGEIAWNQILRNAPTFQKLLAGNLEGDQVQTLQPNIATMASRQPQRVDATNSSNLMERKHAQFQKLNGKK